MSKTLFSLLVFLTITICAKTLKANGRSVLKDTLSEQQKDSIREVALEAIMTYPYIKSS